MAAVLIPTFANLINKANESADLQTVKNLNTILASEQTVSQKKPSTMSEVLEQAESGGYVVDKLSPTSEGNDILWEQYSNRFVLADENGKIIFKDDLTEGDTANDYNFWKITDDASDLNKSQFSLYLSDGSWGTSVTHGAGIDVGENADIDVTYASEAERSGANEYVIERTNGGDLEVNAKNSTVKHYDSAETVKVVAVAENSYHEFGTIGGIILNSGRAVLENKVTVPQVNIQPTEGTAAKLELSSGAQVTNLNVTGAGVTIKNNGTIKNYYTADSSVTIEGTRPESEVEYETVTFTTVPAEGGVEITGVSGALPETLYIPSYIDGEAVVGIGERAFFKGTNLQKVIVAEGVTYIGTFAFAGTASLTNVILPDSLTEIGGSAFKSCSSLTEIEIPENVTVIQSSTFSGCSSLKSVVLPNGLKSIGSSAFSDCALENISLPASLTKLGSGVFTNNTALTSIVVPSGIKELASNTFNGCAGLRSVTLNEGLESIGSSAFKKCSSLVSVEIPNSVTELGLNAFYLCSNLETVKIGDGIKDIGGNSDYPLTFGSCTSLKSITLGVNVTSVNKAAFSGCDKLSEINIDEANPSLSSKGNCIIQRSTNTIIWGFKNTDIAESGAIAIGSSAFYQCAGLTEITIPASIREIGEQAFYGCEDLELLVLECNTAESAKNSSIGFQAFYGCTALKEIRVGQYVSQVEFDYHSSDSKYNAYFGNCPSLQKLTVDEKNEYLYSVDNCIIERGTNQLVLGCKESVIPSDGSVAKIGSYAFYDRGLTKIEIPESVTTIGSSAFSGNRFTTLIIPETVRKIEMYAFNDCDIETLVFDPTVSFGIFAFSGNNIKTIYCLGTQDEWNALDEKLSTSPGIVGNEILLSAKVYIYSQNKPETEGNYWHWGEDNTPEVWETGVVA